MTIKEISKRAIIELKKVGIKTAEIDVAVLLKHAIEEDDVYLLSHPDFPLTNAQYGRFRRYISRRKKGEPVAYITHEKEFYGLNFFVNKNVLIPRPETEALVELANKLIESRIMNHELRILDMGTGSGCIIISLAKKTIIHNSSFIIHFYASDISQKALNVARKNAKTHKVSKEIKFYHSDLFMSPRLPKKFDLILANLPYVPDSDIGKNKEISFEPKSSIFAKENGAEIIKRFLFEAKSKINPGGQILLEADPRNIGAIKTFAKKVYPKSDISIIKDLSKRERFLSILV